MWPYCILYMSDWIVLYVSYTKINVMHLSASFVDTKTTNSAAKQLGLPTGGKTHSNVCTHVEHCHGKQTGQSYLHKCVCVRMKSCLWSFCPESMKQA